MKVEPLVLCGDHPSAGVELRFNGGNTCWTCGECAIITGYSSEVGPFETFDDILEANEDRASQGFPGRWETHDIRYVNGEFVSVVAFNPVTGG
jgi:glutaredoxin-related protein